MPNSPTEGNSGSMFRSLVASVVALAAVAACGEDTAAKAREAAGWLRAYSKENPPNRIWEATSVSITGDNDLVMEVLVTSADHVEKLNLLPKLEQSRIVQIACPPADAELWAILGDDQSLWINLNGEAGPITGGTCKR